MSRSVGGAWPSGKARAFGARIRRFESFRPNQTTSARRPWWRRHDDGDGRAMPQTGFGDLKIFTGSAHPRLAREIAQYLGVPLGQARLRRFPDTEVSFQIDE